MLKIVKIKCNCGKVFHASEGKKRKYCSRDCFHKYSTTRGQARFPYLFSFTANRIKFKCPECGKEEMVLPSRNKKYCDRKCYYKYKRRNK